MYANLPPPRPGRIIFPLNTAASVVVSGNRLWAAPMWTPSHNVLVDQMAIRVTAAGAGSNLNARFGIYRDRNGLPGERLADSGPVDVSTVGPKIVTLASPLLLDSPMWLVSLYQSGNTTQPTVVGVSVAAVQAFGGVLGVATFNNTPTSASGLCAGAQVDSYLYENGLPSDAEQLAWTFPPNTLIPSVALRVAP